MVDFTSVLWRKWQSGYVAGLKPVYGGSIPPFLVTGGLRGWKQIFRSLAKFELGRRQVLRRCGKEEGNREVILRLLLWVPLMKLLV